MHGTATPGTTYWHINPGWWLKAWVTLMHLPTQGTSAEAYQACILHLGKSPMKLLTKEAVHLVWEQVAAIGPAHLHHPVPVLVGQKSAGWTVHDIKNRANIRRSRVCVCISFPVAVAEWRIWRCARPTTHACLYAAGSNLPLSLASMLPHAPQLASEQAGEFTGALHLDRLYCKTFCSGIVEYGCHVCQLHPPPNSVWVLSNSQHKASEWSEQNQACPTNINDRSANVNIMMQVLSHARSSSPEPNTVHMGMKHDQGHTRMHAHLCGKFTTTSRVGADVTSSCMQFGWCKKLWSGFYCGF